MPQSLPRIAAISKGFHVIRIQCDGLRVIINRPKKVVLGEFCTSSLIIGLRIVVIEFECFGIVYYRALVVTHRKLELCPGVVGISILYVNCTSSHCGSLYLSVEKSQSINRTNWLNASI